MSDFDCSSDGGDLEARSGSWGHPLAINVLRRGGWSCHLEGLPLLQHLHRGHRARGALLHLNFLDSEFPIADRCNSTNLLLDSIHSLRCPDFSRFSFHPFSWYWFDQWNSVVSVDLVSIFRSLAAVNCYRFAGLADSLALSRCRYYDRITMNSWSLNRHLQTVKFIQSSILYFPDFPNPRNSACSNSPESAAPSYQWTSICSSSLTHYSSPTFHFYNSAGQSP